MTHAPQSLTLKWGTIKGWNNLSEKSVGLLKRYFPEGRPMSCMLDSPDASRRTILCELIDGIDGEIWNDWEGKLMSKDEAKDYVTNYGCAP